MFVLEDSFGKTMYPDLTYGLLGYLTFSSVSVISKPAACAASVSSFNEGSKTHFYFSNLLPLALGKVLLK